MPTSTPVKVAVLDDYQNVALSMADWSPLAGRADITVFNDHVSGRDALLERLRPFEIVCAMRERTPFPRDIIESLPNLRLIASTGAANASIWMRRPNTAWTCATRAMRPRRRSSSHGR
ncbi:hypothetical protein BSFA1_69390 (plasmid) [Burkholderia sp. SFA1]|nr:hypothetical protein BSFA1_69390 [Burkholderia sp. SFA1]